MILYLALVLQSKHGFFQTNISLFYIPGWKTPKDNPVTWYNQLPPECVTRTTWLKSTTWLESIIGCRPTLEAAYFSIFICGLLKMRNYLSKLYVITSTFMLDFTIWSYTSLYIHLRLAKDAELPPKATCWKLDQYIYGQLTLWRYTFEYVFCDLPKVQNYFYKTSLGQKSKKFIRSPWVKDRRSTGSRLSLSSFVSLLTFFSSLFFYSKTKAIYQMTKNHAANNQYTLSPLTFVL